MKAIVSISPDHLEWAELPLPEPETGQVRIRTAACGICATDLHMISGWERIKYPAIPGHEWSGIVEAVGHGVHKELIGQHCVGQNILSDSGEIGFEHPGGYAQYFVTEAANLIVIPNDFSLIQATLIEPLAVCVRGLKRLSPKNKNSAIIFGDGPIGLIMLCLLKSEGIESVVMVGGNDYRLELAHKFGANMTMNYHELGNQLVGSLLNQYPSGFANLIEASGSKSAISDCLSVSQDKGKILVMGEYGDMLIDLPLNHLLLHELEIIGSNASEGAWNEAMKLAMDDHIPFAELISHTLPAEKYETGLEMARNSRDMIKIILRWMDWDSVS